MPVRIPIAGGGSAPEPPAYGGLGENGWARGRTFLEWIDAAAQVRGEIESAFDAVEIEDAMRRFFTHYPRKVRVAVFAECQEIDSRIAVAQAEHLFSLGQRIWMRIFNADECADLLRFFAGAGAPLPLFIFFSDDRREFARWGPRPGALQDPGAQHEERNAEALERARDAAEHGRELAREFRALLEPRLGAG
ncbi:MAG: thioredoxin family protein [Candidatus Latescibacterota bacterium]|nr:MAG: thioredoxin family protein [Candidatus Latescibacterota bacterium]